MILIIALLVLAGWAIVATIIEVRRDGYRAVPTDWTRVAPAERHGREALDSAEIGRIHR
ncbi:hypothetical protein [Microbacterium sp. XT11]|uniref:hypothetical protein n=1 Tax=Microbacterium sp. XT11 TaxID=367477 RepID=UPI000742ECC3|nr:hypothetical protein [Microbacterium sp. XT11]ALX65847.1 hypothetical protein AB663_000603 [Microbacterium sp. XT11]